VEPSPLDTPKRGLDHRLKPSNAVSWPWLPDICPGSHTTGSRSQPVTTPPPSVSISAFIPVRDTRRIGPALFKTTRSYNKPPSSPQIGTYQKRPRAKKRGQRRGILDRRVPVAPEPERATQREADGADEVPEADVPAEGPRVRRVPVVLHLHHEERAGHDEADASYDLRSRFPRLWF
jgi:hypothetical protein